MLKQLFLFGFALSFCGNSLRAQSENGDTLNSQQFFIRCRKSILESSRPLIIVDGIVYDSTQFDANGVVINSIFNLNPEDVSEISVLKDGLAAVYGDSGKAGVIIVTTKKAKTKKSKKQKRTIEKPTTPKS